MKVTIKITDQFSFFPLVSSSGLLEQRISYYPSSPPYSFSFPCFFDLLISDRSATSFSCRFKEGKKFGSFPCLTIHANMHQCRSKTCQVIYVVHWFYNKISNIARLPRIAQENVLKTNWTVGLLPPLLFSTNPHCNSSVSAKIS